MSIMKDTQDDAAKRAKFLLQQDRPLNEEKVRQLLADDLDAAVFYILLLQARNSPNPTAPSGMVPVYEKPSAKGNKTSPGRAEGHDGSHRPSPLKIDRSVEHRLERCPEYSGELSLCNSDKSTWTRIVEDIPENIQPVVTEHTIHRDYCPNCKKLFEPKIPDALPGSTIGNRLLTLSAHWHYGVGMSPSQIVELLNYHLHFQISEGGLIQM